MKNVLGLFVGIAILSFAGCSSSTPPKNSPEKKEEVNNTHFRLTPEERAELKCKKSCTLSEALCKRLINNSKELHLTPEELEVLKRTGKVILCGKCGHLLGTKAHAKWKTEKEPAYKPEDDFVPNSLRGRILEISIN